jgi:hypothetical protein
MITKDDMRTYLAAFNRKDLNGFGRFYAGDVTLNLNGKQILPSRQAIFDFYGKVWDRCDERLDLMAIVVDEDGAALHLGTEFKALRDDPDFIAGPLVPGQSIFLESLVFYRFENGLIQSIRSFRASAPSTGPSTF